MNIKNFSFTLILILINFVVLYYNLKYLSSFQSIFVVIISLITSWIISNVFHNRITFSKVSPENRAVLITGCDTGFGHQLAIEVDKLGFHVFAGVLFPEGVGAKNLVSVCSDRLNVLKMDVTNYEEVSCVINEIYLSGLELWAVVNNAGIAFNTPIEWGFDINELNKVFSINVFGAVRVAKLSLPLLRQSKGRIINVSSIAGNYLFKSSYFTYLLQNIHF
jgi:short-subunit dehydrogenase involved in D-alanine esterification of teichoic acids